MEISTPYASQLKLVDLMIVESSFSRTEKEIQDAALEMEIEKDIQKQSEDHISVCQKPYQQHNVAAGNDADCAAADEYSGYVER